MKPVTRRDQRVLMRLLHGELTAEQARQVRARLVAERPLAAAYRALEAAWTSLDAAAVRGAAEERAAILSALESPAAETWAEAPRWARWASVCALLVGIGIGLLAGASPVPDGVETLLLPGPESLAEDYWSVITAEVMPETGR